MGVISNRRWILSLAILLARWSWPAFSFQVPSVSVKRPISSSAHLHLITRVSGNASSRRYSSQWDDEDDDVTTKSASFDQAKEKLKNEDDQEKLTSSGDFDANPSVSVEC
jgi:hypothetical protein